MRCSTLVLVSSSCKRSAASGRGGAPAHRESGAGQAAPWLSSAPARRWDAAMAPRGQRGRPRPGQRGTATNGSQARPSPPGSPTARTAEPPHAFCGAKHPQPHGRALGTSPLPGSQRGCVQVVVGGSALPVGAPLTCPPPPPPRPHARSAEGRRWGELWGGGRRQKRSGAWGGAGSYQLLAFPRGEKGRAKLGGEERREKKRC